MDKCCYLFLFVVFFYSCNESSVPTQDKPVVTVTNAVDLNKYPKAIQNIFAKHGSLEAWNKMNSMSYEIVEEEGNEKQFIDLKNRWEKIEAATFSTGFDGKDFWLEADSTYKGNPVFYHNLMFYFYAMPFVVADPGVLYSEADPISYEGKSYPGIRISYEDGVGVSSKDEYFVHYDPSTSEMAWLGYTVTYFSKEISKKTNWIRYDDWKEINGLLLPNSMTWFKVEDGKLIEPRSKREFVNVVVSEKVFGLDIFAKPQGAEIVE